MVDYNTYRPGFALLPSRCSLCSQGAVGLWCKSCLRPFVSAGERWLETEGPVITVRYKPSWTPKASYR